MTAGRRKSKTFVFHYVFGHVWFLGVQAISVSPPSIYAPFMLQTVSSFPSEVRGLLADRPLTAVQPRTLLLQQETQDGRSVHEKKTENWQRTDDSDLLRGLASRLKKAIQRRRLDIKASTGHCSPPEPTEAEEAGDAEEEHKEQWQACEGPEEVFASRYRHEAGELAQVNEMARALRVIARSEVGLSEHIPLLTEIAGNLTKVAAKQRARDNSVNEDQGEPFDIDLLRTLQDRSVSISSIMNTDIWMAEEVRNFEYVSTELLLALAAIEDPSIAQKRLAELSPSIFVAIFTARSSVVRRRLVRDMWVRASKITGDRIMAKFVVCKDEDGRQHELLGEARAFEDLLFLDCQEGYNRTMLTKKLFVAMRAYAELYSDMQLFMKVDDDTFVAWKRLIRVLARKSGPVAYMGVPSPEGKKVNREPDSIWYQPYETYPNKTYPMNMEGGPGYLMGRDLVHAILTGGIAERNLGLSNEDQACGIWVHMVRQLGVHVNSVPLTGTDGYKPEYDVCSGKWGDYPYLMHHKLEGEVISCLADVDAENDADMRIDDCFFICHQDLGGSPYLVDHVTGIDAAASQPAPAKKATGIVTVADVLEDGLP